MIEFIKKYPYYTVVILLAFLKILGIVNCSWWLVTLPIWWWWPIAIFASTLAIGYIILEEIIKKKNG
tara:strand:+ start:2238 stop:2438 length:201 start_codon:yes stop_codon:yes gene_type:complete